MEETGVPGGNHRPTDEATKYRKVNCVVIHQITNDVKQMDAASCPSEMIVQIRNIKRRFVQARVVVSLGTPRVDGYQETTSQVNKKLCDALHEDTQIITCHHENLQHEENIRHNLYGRDKKINKEIKKCSI